MVSTAGTIRPFPAIPDGRHAFDPHKFSSREAAGRELALLLTDFARRPDVIVLALPHGGVPVGAEIARLLRVPFDILLVGKIIGRHHAHPVLGAITSGGVRMLDTALIDRLHISHEELSHAILRESLKLARRERFYRGRQPSLDVADRTVILVDDGSTPCETVRNAIRLLRRQHAEHIIVALPAACQHAACDLRLETEQVVTLTEPASASSAGKIRRHFPKITRGEVCRLMALFHPAEDAVTPACRSDMHGRADEVPA